MVKKIIFFVVLCVVVIVGVITVSKIDLFVNKLIYRPNVEDFTYSDVDRVVKRLDAVVESLERLEATLEKILSLVDLVIDNQLNLAEADNGEVL